jgi:DNA-binding MarR family transcriptional regulator
MPTPPSPHRRWRELAQLLNPDIDPTTLQIWEEFYRVAYTLRRIGEGSLAAAGLSHPQYRILLSLLRAEHFGDEGGLNPSEISRTLGVSRNAVSALVRSLEQAGLIARSLDPADRRRFDLTLTEAGRDLARRHARHHTATIGRCFESFDEGERGELARLLHKLGDAGQAQCDHPEREVR